MQTERSGAVQSTTQHPSEAELRAQADRLARELGGELDIERLADETHVTLVNGYTGERTLLAVGEDGCEASALWIALDDACGELRTMRTRREADLDECRAEMAADLADARDAARWGWA